MSDGVDHVGANMQCPSCRNENRLTAVFCDRCGHSLGPSAAVELTQTELRTSNVRVQGDWISRDKILNIVKHIYVTRSRSSEEQELAAATQRYLTHLIEHHQYMNWHGVRVGQQPINLALEQLFVPPILYAPHRQERGADQPRRRSRTPFVETGHTLTSVLQQSHMLVIVGDPGHGKSMLLNYLLLTYARTARSNHNLVTKRLGLDEGPRLPFLLPLPVLGAALARRVSQAEQDFPGLFLKTLAKHYADLKLPKGFLRKALEQGNSIVLFDGLDEIPKTKRRLEAARLIEQVASRFPGNRFIVTSRRGGYRGKFRIQEDFAHVELGDFNSGQIQQFLRQWVMAQRPVPGRTTESVTSTTLVDQNRSLLATIDLDPGVAELAANPLFLTVLALISRNRAKFPKRRTALYAEAVDLLLGHWNDAKDGAPPTMFINGRMLDTTDWRALLELVAAHLQERGQIELDSAGLESVLGPIFMRLVRNKEQVRQLLIRFLTELQERSGLLVSRGAGRFGFAHRAFQEYLAARALEQRDDAATVVQNRVNDPTWREVLFLAPGSHGDRRTGSTLIRALIDAPQVSDRLENLVLASECLAVLGAVQVEGDLAPRLSDKLSALIQAPEPSRRTDRRRWILQKVLATNALRGMAQPEPVRRFWREDTGEPDWVRIAADPEFPMEDAGVGSGAIAAGTVSLGAFSIAPVPITNAQYDLYVTDTGVRPPVHWRDSKPPKGKEDHPVVFVSWDDAQAYCVWLSARTGWNVRLPTEAQWEKAARGSRGQVAHPWGGEWKVDRCNSSELDLLETSPVGLFAAGASSDGVLDLVGNVWEWCHSLMRPYPYRSDDGREDPEAQGRRVIRGGSFFTDRECATCSYRLSDPPKGSYDDLGFRVVRLDPDPDEGIRT